MSKQLIRGALTLLAALAVPQVASAYCATSYNDQFGLASLPYKEQCGSWVTSAKPYTGSCPLLPNHKIVTRENFTPAFNHWHLSWDDPNINCIAADNCFGRTNGNKCEVVDHMKQLRHMTSHMGSQWLQIAVENSAGQMISGTFSGIRIKGTVSADVWFQKTNGSWQYYNDLAPGKWSFLQTSVFRVVVHRDVDNAPYSFDDVIFG